MGLITLPTRITGKVFAKIFEPSVVQNRQWFGSACNLFCPASCMLAAAA